MQTMSEAIPESLPDLRARLERRPDEKHRLHDGDPEFERVRRAVWQHYRLEIDRRHGVDCWPLVLEWVEPDGTIRSARWDDLQIN